MSSRGTISLWGDLLSRTSHRSLFLPTEGRRNKSYTKPVEEPGANTSSQEKYINASSARLSFLGGKTPQINKNTTKKSHSQAFVTVVIQTFLKPLKLIKILGLMPKAGQGCIKKGGKHTPSAWMCCHNTSVGCNLDSHSSSLLPLFLYIKFHSNLIILIAAFLNSKQTAPRNGAFRGTQWAGDIFFFFWH